MELFININRLHPLLVHLPIGILLMAFLMQLHQWWKKENQFEEAIKFSLLLAFIFSVLAIITGWRLANEGGYDLNAIWWHKWMGIATSIITGLLFVAKGSQHKLLRKIFGPALIGAVGLLGATGHQGGTITHGADYLFSFPIDHSFVVEDIKTANAYEAIIFPILDSKCISCHNPAKLKGDLLMTTTEGLLAGGKEGPVFDFEFPEKSTLLQRVHLPLAEKKHMPPKGKQQLTNDEKEILAWWIKNKACFDCIVDSLSGATAIMPLLKKYESVQTDIQAITLPVIAGASLKALERNDIPVYPIDAESNFVNINLSHRKNISKAQLKALKKIGAHILELDVSHSNFGDKFANIFSKLPNLQKLQLQQSQITNRSLKSLEKLKYLKSLNLYGTKIDDQGIAEIQAIPSLKKIYLWNSKFSAAGIDKLQEAMPLLNINYQLDENIFGASTLKSPQIVADQIFFLDSTQVELRTNFPGIEIFYTLDSTSPDSNATPYSQPITLTNSTTLKFFSRKSGWKDSPIDSISLIKGSNFVSTVRTLPAPDKNYPGKGSLSLFDLKKGTKDFKDGAWLGYQGINFSSIYEFDQAQVINKVYVSSLEHQGSWIFFPRGFKVWTSVNGKDFKMVSQQKFPAPIDNAELRQKVFTLNFSETEARYVKIEVLNQGKNPAFHASPGGASWVFVDEIVVSKSKM